MPSQSSIMLIDLTGTSTYNVIDLTTNSNNVIDLTTNSNDVIDLTTSSNNIGITLHQPTVPIIDLTADSEGEGNSNEKKSAFICSQLPVAQLTEDIADNCVICMEQFCSGDTCQTLPCFHRFHKHCISKWLESKLTCPMCKHLCELPHS